jgi:hypothetical protein
MAEWLKAHAWKACVRETVPWVRIPLSPPPKTFMTLRLRKYFVERWVRSPNQSPNTARRNLASLPGQVRKSGRSLAHLTVLAIHREQSL